MKKNKGGIALSKRLYIAYGSNLNMRQMSIRCPTARLVGMGRVNGYELQFKGSEDNAFATISEKDGASVPVAVWELQDKDERSLNIYEGYPRHYFKKDISVKMKGKEISGMAYIMNLSADFNMPSQRYLNTVVRGYHDCGFDTKVIDDALELSSEMIELRENTEDEDEDFSFDSPWMQ